MKRRRWITRTSSKSLAESHLASAPVVIIIRVFNGHFAEEG